MAKRKENNISNMSRDELRKITKSLYDIQDLRIKVSARLQRKADETPMKDNGTEATVLPDSYLVLNDLYDDLKETERKYENMQKKAVESSPEWNLFLKDVKGIGPKMAAVLTTEIDIEEATTVSKIWQYAGLNPGLVPAKKPGKERGTYVTTGEMIRGDRPSSGYLLPYNKYLKTKLMGVLADSFIKSKSPYSKFYYDYKARLENSESTVQGKDKKWSEESKAHRNMAAKRYLVKMFLVDYYKEVRKIYNLPVREPYMEEYLGKVHSAQTASSEKQPKHRKRA